MRQDRLELRRQQLTRTLRHALPHTTTSGTRTGTYGLFIDEP
jgi:hypothetical protein